MRFEITTPRLRHEFGSRVGGRRGRGWLIDGGHIPGGACVQPPTVLAVGVATDG